MKYKSIIDCFIYVAFWNLIGAGFLGFIINPPLSQYYMIGGYLGGETNTERIPTGSRFTCNMFLFELLCLAGSLERQKVST